MEPSGKPYLSCGEAKNTQNKQTNKKEPTNQQTNKTSNPLQQKTKKKRSPALFNFHLLPPRFLTPLQLAILPSTVLFPGNPSLHTALPSLPFFLKLLGLSGEGEREDTGGWRRAGSEFPTLAPSPLLLGPSHGQALPEACFLEEGLLRVSHSRLHSVSTVTPLPSRPGVVMAPALESAWTLTLLLASFHLAFPSESSCSTDLSIVKSFLVCPVWTLSGTFEGEKNP